MMLHTCSETISFARELEEQVTRFYDRLAELFPGDKETWQLWAKENRRFVTQIEQAYYGVISDAIEGCFAFEMESDKYLIDSRLFSTGGGYPGVLDNAVRIEEKMVQFYTDAAEQSQSLMADIPRTFNSIVKKRMARQAMLEELARKNPAES